MWPRKARNCPQKRGNIAEVKVAVVAEVAAYTKKVSKKCHFADILSCLGSHSSLRCKIFAKLPPEERDQISLDNEMCSFYLLHRKDDVCHRRARTGNWRSKSLNALKGILSIVGHR